MVPRWFVAIGLVGPLLVVQPDQAADARLQQPEGAVLPRIAENGRVLGTSAVVLDVDPATGLPRDASRTLFDTLLGATALGRCAVDVQALGRIAAADLDRGDVLGAHRRARSHAAAVADALQQAGVPDERIRVGWDASRPVASPQVVLWIATPWDDAECDAIRPARAALVAVAAPPPAVTAATAPTGPAAATPPAAGATPAPPSPPHAAATAAAGPDRVGVAAERPAAASPEPAGLAQAPGADRPAATVVARLTPGYGVPQRKPAVEAGASAAAASRSAPKAAAPVPASVPAGTVRPPLEPAARLTAIEPAAGADHHAHGPAGVAAGRDLRLVFPVNSSFLDAAQKAELAAAVAAAPAGRALQVRLEVAIGADDVPGAGPEEALRYNRWLAERRLKRIEGRLREAARPRAVEVVPAWREGDPSRSVTIRLATSS